LTAQTHVLVHRAQAPANHRGLHLSFFLSVSFLALPATSCSTTEATTTNTRRLTALPSVIVCLCLCCSKSVCSCCVSQYAHVCPFLNLHGHARQTYANTLRFSSEGIKRLRVQVPSFNGLMCELDEIHTGLTALFADLLLQTDDSGTVFPLHRDENAESGSRRDSRVAPPPCVQ
jgi:hypothetical protein